MSFLGKIIANFKIRTKDGLVEIKGPNWVKPSFSEFMQELKTEWNTLYESAVESKQLQSLYYDHTEVELFAAEKIKEIDINTNPGFPVINKKGPSSLSVEWLLDPNVKPDSNWSRENSKHRYSSKHHQDVLKAFKEGGDLDMPILFRYNGYLGAISGRHRITYSMSLKIPLKALVISSEKIKEILESDRE